MPAPITRDVSPPFRLLTLTACSATETASTIAASANEIEPGSGQRIRSGTAMYSAKAPARRYSPQATPTT